MDFTSDGLKNWKAVFLLTEKNVKRSGLFGSREVDVYFQAYAYLQQDYHLLL